MSGVVREHILSSSDPSCIGFERKNGQVVPVFEMSDKCVPDLEVIEQIQKGAVEFVEDFVNLLGVYRKQISIKPQEISLPYEGFIRFASDMDLKVFSASFFEDEVWGGKTRINIADFIKQQHREYSMMNSIGAETKIERIIEQNPAIERIKNKLNSCPLFYRIVKWLYRRFE